MWGNGAKQHRLAPAGARGAERRAGGPQRERGKEHGSDRRSRSRLLESARGEKTGYELGLAFNSSGDLVLLNFVQIVRLPMPFGGAHMSFAFG